MSPEEWLRSQGAEVFDVRTPGGQNVQIDVAFPGAATAAPTTPAAPVAPPTGVTPVMSPEEWAASTSAQPPETTVRGLAGAATRGLAPVAAGATLGAAMGAPFAGVGAVPGAVAGAGAAGLAMTVGDPIVSTINSLFGTQYTLPTQAMEDLLTRLGVPQARTEAERIVQSTVGGAAVAGGTAQAGQAIMQAAGASAPVTREVARQLAAQPATQIAAGAGAGLASQAAQEAGFGPAGQVVAGLAGGMGVARGMAPRTPVQQLPSDIEEAQRAGITVMTSDVVPPRTFAQKWMQAVGERMPVTGTGPVRQAQQAQRVEAVKNIARDYGIADERVVAKQIWDDLARRRGDELNRYVGAKEEVISKISQAQSGRAQGEVMLREADELTRKAGQLYADQAKLMNRVQELTRRDLGWAGQQRIDRLNDRIAEYRSAIEEAQAQAVQKRNAAQQMIENVSGKAVNVGRTTAAIDTEIAKLEALNNPQFSSAIQILRDWRSSIQNQDLANLEVLRKQLGEAFKDPQLGQVRTIGEKAVSNIYRPIVEDMGDFIRANGDRRDFTKWQVANARLNSMMDELDGTALSSVLKRGDQTPEAVNELLFSKKPSEVARLYRNLSPEGRANARSAIIARAVERAGGIDNISPDRFANQVRDLGKSINIFFTGDDLQRVQGLARVLQLTKRAGEAAALPPSGVQNFYAMLGVGTGGLGGGIPGAVTAAGGIATVGGAARLYESAAVRNMLLRFPQLRPGSAEEAELLKRLMSTLAAEQRVPVPQEE